MKSTTSAPLLCSIRLIIAFIGFFGMIIHFSQKSNVSIALVCMVNHSAIDSRYVNTTSPSNVINSNECSQIKKQHNTDGPFVWSKDTQGLILGAYFWGYIITQIPAGYLANRFGARFIFSAAIFVSSSATLLVPISARVDWIIFAVLQIIIGVAHGTIWPCLLVTASNWIPTHERGMLMSIITTGSPVGNIFALSTGGLMCSWNFLDGWPLIFYTTGSMGLIWSLVWIWFYRNSPTSHRFISSTEKDFILQHTQHRLSKNKNDDDGNAKFHAPWRAIFTSRACWALFIIHTCSNYGTYTFLTSIPSYMSDVLKFDVKSNGILSASPYFGIWLNTLFTGAIADRIIRKRILTITHTRKLFSFLGSILPAVILVGLAFLTCQSKYFAVLLLIIGMTVNAFSFGGGFLLVANDIAPAYAGIVFGISNTFATLPGIISTYVVGALTDKDPGNWRIVFFICSSIYVFGTVIFLLFGSSEIQPWAMKHVHNDEVSHDLLSKQSEQSSLKTIVKT
ncbi:unnamed protein product [Adineta ricciae]|uniref:Major facilitator superfamily (MFS) profile domain-containing protein n=1 Tax=Adineta ricciae TaxID=249248 RepID=A0A814AIR1_ADIRI|nr:unnamed protein product [Adineta ricciae]